MCEARQSLNALGTSAVQRILATDITLYHGAVDARLRQLLQVGTSGRDCHMVVLLKVAQAAIDRPDPIVPERSSVKRKPQTGIRIRGECRVRKQQQKLQKSTSQFLAFSAFDRLLQLVSSTTTKERVAEEQEEVGEDGQGCTNSQDPREGPSQYGPLRYQPEARRVLQASCEVLLTRLTESAMADKGTSARMPVTLSHRDLMKAEAHALGQRGAFATDFAALEEEYPKLWTEIQNSDELQGTLSFLKTAQIQRLLQRGTAYRFARGNREHPDHGISEHCRMLIYRLIVRVIRRAAVMTWHRGTKGRSYLVTNQFIRIAIKDALNLDMYGAPDGRKPRRHRGEGREDRTVRS